VAQASLLPWLLPAPADFRQRCGDVDKAAGARGRALQLLASYELNENQLHRLARSVRAAIESDAEAPLGLITLGIVSNATTDFIVPALEGSAARYNIALRTVAAPFGVTIQAALAPDSTILNSQPDVMLLALDYRAFFADYSLDDSAETKVDAAIAHVRDLRDAFASASGAAVIVQTIAAPPERMFGSFDRRQHGTPAWLSARFNERLVSEILEAGTSLLDVEGLADRLGLAHWHDRAQHMTARLPFAARFVPYYADYVARLLAALRGKARKVLALDLDNTLWGGVIGDDGVDGIVLGQGSARGEAFLDVQRAALALKQRGVLLALCSKNDEAIALKAIREHPEMLLRETDFSARQINWNDKATNLEAIAEYLSLGLDSFVLLDDSPAERAQVRQALPQVSVLELPSDPAAYARNLLDAGLFEASAFSDEDRLRADAYAANAKRDSLRTQTRDLGAFLQSLEMSAGFVSDGNVGWSRFAQLINKSNQFNLTTRRYTEAEIAAVVRDPRSLALQMRLIDKFGDNGMISAIICTSEGSDWVLDTWVMSCRVLGRKVEEAALNEIVRRASAAGVTRLRGIYRPTDRNALVKDHYENLGFSQVAQTDGAIVWELDLAGFVARDVPIMIQSPP
jgi:FkbH-like protein